MWGNSNYLQIAVIKDNITYLISHNLRDNYTKTNLN